MALLKLSYYALQNLLEKNMDSLTLIQVKERPKHRPRKPGESTRVFNSLKSYHYIEDSEVNIFLLYCGAHNESVAIEIKHTHDLLPSKIQCCFVLKDTKCKNLANNLEGEIELGKFLLDTFNSRSKLHKQIILRSIVGMLRSFMLTKYHDVHNRLGV